MTRRSLPLLLLALLASCAAPNPLQAEIEARTAEWTAMFDAGDYAGVAQVYADDAILLGPDAGRTEGREAIDAYWADSAGRPWWRLETHVVEGGDGEAGGGGGL